MTPSPDPLDDLVKRWGENAPPLPASVRPEVWRRVARAEAAPLKAGWLARLEADFARPAFAGAFIAACTLLGLFLAEVRLSRLHAQRDAQLARSYLTLVDPLFADAAARPRPNSPHS